MTLFIGLISGTSVDAVDAVLCDISPDQPIKLLHSHNHPIPTTLQKELLDFGKSQYQGDAVDQLGQLDHQVGLLFAEATHALLELSEYKASDIAAIGSHGQTVRHRPNAIYPFTLQIGDPNIIATKTGITTVADFRRRDMANGGQGAPFAPAFHQAFFSDKNSPRAIINLGGIANVTLLQPNQDPIGFDTGPANTLMDHWIYQHKNKHYDADGQWASSGHIIPELLQWLLTDPYFSQPAPKSTGCEYFNAEWLTKTAQQPLSEYLAADVQRTLLELTVTTVANAVSSKISQGDIYLCGGGAHNALLTQQLQKHLPDFTVSITSDLGVAPDWVEAMTFAWFASKTLNKESILLSSITGSANDSILGGVYFC
ncbi:anhydro-N-acetylmuramic acid kinase [Kangiella sp. HD9-110m-PIT-SAG06]|nr:anhydro-N-acetylmuramic acid kinase [Kangiella sp. HD9-110m-PIT-SAG06]RDX36768.1 anhydro-N-acetylmuramic acid kinase [Kangiella sp. HD9-110m-PIT-SAG07]